MKHCLSAVFGSRPGQVRRWPDYAPIAQEALSAGLVKLIPEERSGGVQRRQARASVPRRWQVVVRLSSAELGLVRDRAALAGLAVGARVGQAAIAAAECGTSASIGLPDLLRLHARRRPSRCGLVSSTGTCSSGPTR